eukprot:30871-Pelagococcus_subviridis.AAC.8
MRPSSRTASSSSSSRVLRADAARTRGGVSRSSRPDGGVRVAGLALGNLSLLLLALLLALSALATTADATSGTYVDVTVSYTSQVAGRFGYQPTQRSGQSMVRARVRPSFGFWIPTRPRGSSRLFSSPPPQLLLSPDPSSPRPARRSRPSADARGFDRVRDVRRPRRLRGVKRRVGVQPLDRVLDASPRGREHARGRVRADGAAAAGRARRGRASGRPVDLRRVRPGRG